LLFAQDQDAQPPHARSAAGRGAAHHPRGDPDLHHHRARLYQGGDARESRRRGRGRRDMIMPTPLTPDHDGGDPQTPGPAGPPLKLARRMNRMPPSAVREILKVAEQPDVLSFAGGLPAPELFPVAEIAEAYAETLAREGAAALQYSTTEGYGPLREWVVDRLARRGIRATPDQVLITNGSQQG